MITVKKILPVIAVLILSFWAVKPLFVSGFFTMHDDTQVQRVYEMQKALSDGLFPVRWVPDLGYGYGYPLFNFYAPLAYYVGGFLNLSGVNALISTKIMMGLGFVASGIFMYLFAKEIWGKIGGTVSAVLYLYAPYHAVDMYVRGDVAEFYAYAFIPLVFLAMYKIYRLTSMKTKTQKRTNSLLWIWVSLGSVSYACIILSHNLTAMMVTPYVFVFAVLLFALARVHQPVNKQYFLFIVLIFGIFLSAFYWLPTLTEMKYTNVISQLGGGSNYKDNYACLSELWSSPWGYGGSIPGCIKGLSLRVGKLHVILAILSLFPLAYFLVRKKNKTIISIMIFSIFSLVFSVFLMLSQSEFIWNAIPQMAFFQFPWRFLVMVSFFCSFLSGSVFYVLGLLIPDIKIFRLMFYVFASIAVIGIVVFNAKVFIPQTILTTPVSGYTSQYDLEWVTSRISDEYMPANFFVPLVPWHVPKSPFSILNKPFTVSNLYKKTQLITADIRTNSQTDILVNLAYFPTWHIYIDQKQVWFKYFNRGLIVTVPKGTHSIALMYSQTLFERLGNMLSLTGVIILFIGIITTQRSVYEQEKRKG